MARFGFMERPDMPALLHETHAKGCRVDLSDVTYYVGHETVVHREDGPALPKWIEQFYALMQRNSVHVSDYFRLPADCVVEIAAKCRFDSLRQRVGTIKIYNLLAFIIGADDPNGNGFPLSFVMNHHVS